MIALNNNSPIDRFGKTGMLNGYVIDSGQNEVVVLSPVFGHLGQNCVSSCANVELRDIVLERANSIDTNTDCVAAGQREVVLWDDAGPGHQKHPSGKAVVAKKELR